MIRFFCLIGGLGLWIIGSIILKVPFYDTDSIGLVYTVKGTALVIMVLALFLFLKVFKTKGS